MRLEQPVTPGSKETVSDAGATSSWVVRNQCLRYVKIFKFTVILKNLSLVMLGGC